MKEVNVPVLFFLGRHEHHLDAAMAARYLEKLRAPANAPCGSRTPRTMSFEEPNLFNAKVI